MSYCVLPNGLPETKRLTIVFWFRVRQNVLDLVTKAAHDFMDHSPNDVKPVLLGIVPLMTFGAENYFREYAYSDNLITGPEGQDYDWDNTNAVWVPHGSPFSDVFNDRNLAFTGSRRLIDPSYIGIDCFGDYPALSINIGMSGSDVATYKYGPHFRDSAPTGDPPGLYFAPGGTTAPGSPTSYIYAPGTEFQDIFMDYVSGGPLSNILTRTQTSDRTYSNILLGAAPEIFRTRPIADFNQISAGPDASSRGGTLSQFNAKGFRGPRIEADRWNCVQFSIDVSAGIETKGRFVQQRSIDNRDTGVADVTVTGDQFDPGVAFDPYDDSTKYIKKSAKMFLAVNDENLTGMDMSVYHPHSGYRDKNALLSVNSWITGNATTFSIISSLQPRAGRGEDSSILRKRAEYSLPARNIPLSHPIGFPATAQYVDNIHDVQMGALQMYTDRAPDWGITAVRRSFVNKDGKPAPIGDAEEVMGKKPEVWMPKRSNFQTATNAGTYHGGSDPENKGTAVGDIDPFRPDPNLRGSQTEIPLKKD